MCLLNLMYGIAPFAILAFTLKQEAPHGEIYAILYSRSTF